MSREGGLASAAPWANRAALRPGGAFAAHSQRFCGEVAERSIAPHSKCGLRKRNVGSNPTLSARNRAFAALFCPDMQRPALRGKRLLPVAFAVAGALFFAALGVAGGAAGAFFVQR